MFCSKCGTKAREGAVFCGKCGARLIQDNREEQRLFAPIQEAVEIPNPSVGTSQSQGINLSKKRNLKKSRWMEEQSKLQNQMVAQGSQKSQEEIYALLEKEAEGRYGVKSVKIMRNGLRVRGRTHVHFINIMNGTAKLQSRFILIFALLGAWAGNLGFNMGWNAMEQGYIYFEDYAWTFVLFPIIVGLLIALMPYIGYGEKASVRECVRKIVEPEGISLKTNEMKPTIRFVTSAILILIGVMVFVFGVLGVEFGGRGSGFGTVFSDEDSDDSYDLDRDESVSLKRSYVNEDEGFSFMYPSDWNIEENVITEDVLQFVIISAPFELEYRAFMGVGKEETNEETIEMYFSATSSDFEIASSLNNMKLISLTDLTINGYAVRKLIETYTHDRGTDLTRIQYFYIVNSDMYFITCFSRTDLFDKYEPIFDAIMDSYTITLAASATSNQNADICFNGIPVQELLGLSAAEVVWKFGGSYSSDNGMIFFEDIDFNIRDDETVDSIWIWSLEKFSINGKSLKVNSDGVIESETIINVFGQDYEDEWLDDIGYVMSYHYPAYTLSFEINKFNELCRIMLRNRSGPNLDH